MTDWLEETLQEHNATDKNIFDSTDFDDIWDVGHSQQIFGEEGRVHAALDYDNFLTFDTDPNSPCDKPAKSHPPKPAGPISLSVTEMVESEQSRSQRPRRKAFTAAQQKTLTSWFNSNIDKPYPLSTDKLGMSKSTGLSIKQISSWFSRTRQRKFSRETWQRACMDEDPVLGQGFVIQDILPRRTTVRSNQKTISTPSIDSGAPGRRMRKSRSLPVIDRAKNSVHPTRFRDSTGFQSCPTHTEPRSEDDYKREMDRNFLEIITNTSIQAAPATEESSRKKMAGLTRPSHRYNYQLRGEAEEAAIFCQVDRIPDWLSKLPSTFEEEDTIENCHLNPDSRESTAIQREDVYNSWQQALCRLENSRDAVDDSKLDIFNRFQPFHPEPLAAVGESRRRRSCSNSVASSRDSRKGRLFRKPIRFDNSSRVFELKQDNDRSFTGLTGLLAETDAAADSSILHLGMGQIGNLVGPSDAHDARDGTASRDLGLSLESNQDITTRMPRSKLCDPPGIAMGSKCETRAKSCRGTKRKRRKVQYYCTFCHTTPFDTRYLWRRHEEAVHVPQKLWICGPSENGSSSVNELMAVESIYAPTKAMIDELSYDNKGDMNNPTAFQHMSTFLACWVGPVEGRTFHRKDSLAQHIRLVHFGGAAFDTKKLSPDYWSNNIQTSPYSPVLKCGFCHQQMQDWESRVDHIAAHFEAETYEYSSGAPDPPAVDRERYPTTGDRSFDQFYFPR